MKNIKSNYYNLLIPVPEADEYLIYNTATGGLEVIPDKLGSLFSQWISDGGFDEEDYPYLSDFISEFKAKGFLASYDSDDIENLHNIYLKKRQASFFRDKATIFLTIGTTINCNMDCPYCFQFEKPNKSLRDETVVEEIVRYMEQMITTSPVKGWDALHVTWFGGEPLVNKNIIEVLTPKFVKLCEQYGLKFQGDIVTNGILLTREVWEFLVANKVETVQVTVDGPQETHDLQRPLKSKHGKNYHQILENLAFIPDKVRVNIRVNIDRKVAGAIGKLLDDLSAYKIWPHKYKNVIITPAWLRTYEGEANWQQKEKERFTNEEFFDFTNDFRKMQLERYNTWAEDEKIPPAKLKWVLPELQDECPTWASPYAVVIDPDGNVHKCWETIHDHQLSAGLHVSDGYDREKLTYYTNYDRFTVHEICHNCQFLPVCDKLSCAIQSVTPEKPPCTYWKERARSAIKDQYLFMLNNGDLISDPTNGTKVNTGHSNK